MQPLTEHHRWQLKIGKLKSPNHQSDAEPQHVAGSKICKYFHLSVKDISIKIEVLKMQINSDTGGIICSVYQKR